MGRKALLLAVVWSVLGVGLGCESAGSSGAYGSTYSEPYYTEQETDDDDEYGMEDALMELIENPPPGWVE